jgi:SHS2 domain-containing protein
VPELTVAWRYLEDVAIADVAFEAWAPALGALFADAVDATLGVMAEEPAAIRALERRHASLASEALDLLLFQLLAEIIYFKDAEQLLLRCPHPSIDGAPGAWRLEADLEGERIDPSRHRLLLDVKAVTLHLLSVEQSADGWRARVVLDI